MKKKGKTVKRSVVSLTAKSKVKKQTFHAGPESGPDGKPMAQVIQQIELSFFIPTPDNKRVIDEKSEAFKDLLSSVKANGVEFAVIARPHPDKVGKLDLRAGARRLRAAQLAGLATIPAIVRPMTDAEAINITYLENLRENLTPLQECELFAEMLAKNGGDYQAIAGGMGKSPAWVALRANVGKNLSAAWRKAIGDHDTIFRAFGVSHYELIARLEPEAQDRLLNEWTENAYGDQCDLTVADIKRDIESEMQVLGKAGWGMTDKLHCKGDADTVDYAMPTCQECTKRTGARPMLFEDLGKKDKQERCLDPVCFGRKQVAAIQATIDAKKEKYPSLAVITEPYKLSYPKTKLFGDVQSKANFQPCKKDDKKAVPCIEIDANAGGGGNVVWMKPVEGRKESSSGRGNQGPKTRQQKDRELFSKRWFYILKQLDAKLEKTTLDRTKPGDKVAMLTVLVLAYGVDTSALTLNNIERYEDNLAWDHLIGRGGNRFNSNCEEFAETLADLWLMVRDKLADEMRYSGPVTQVGDGRIEMGEHVAWLIGADLEELMMAAKQEHPTPRSWGKQATATVVSGESMTKENNHFDETDDHESGDEED